GAWEELFLTRFFLTSNKQGGKTANGGVAIHEEITFICHRDRSLGSDHSMPNDVNWRRYSVSEGNATLTGRVQTEDGNHPKAAATRKRIAGRQGFSGQLQGTNIL